MTKEEITQITYIWGKCVDCGRGIGVKPEDKDEPHFCLICSALRQGIDVEAILNGNKRRDKGKANQ